MFRKKVKEYAGLLTLTLTGLLILFGTQIAWAAEPGDVIINEIMQNPAAVSDSDGEWFEVYNPTSSDIDINGWTIQDLDNDLHEINNAGPLVIPAGGYLVLGNNTDSGTNGGVEVAYSYGSNFFLANGADELILIDTAGLEIDRVEWDGGPEFPDPNGASMSLSDPTLDNNLGANWCESTTPFGAGDLGTPGGENVCEVEPPPPSDSVVIIHEIMQNPAAVSDSDGEWFEVYNPTESEIDIEGWTIKDDDFDSHVISNAGPLVIPAGGYLVLGNNADSATNGGVSVDYAYGDGFFLANGADELILIDTAGLEIDRVEWDGGPEFPDPNGASMALIDPSLDNNVGGNWCTSSTPYGAGDFGTPGAENDCPVCGDPFTPIYEIQGSGSSSPIVGQLVSTEGVVVGSFQGDNQFNGFYIQDPVGDGDPNTSDGIFVFNPGGMLVAEGDAVRVTGEVDEFFGMTELTEVSLVLSCGTGSAVAPTPVQLPVEERSELERFEGMAVTFPQQLNISEFFNFDRFGEIVLTTERQFQGTAIFEPGSPDYFALAEFNQLSRITLDDGRSNQNPDPAIHPNGQVFDLDNLFRGGDIVQNATGVLDYRFSLYRIQPTKGADFTPMNPRPEAHDPVGGSLEVAAFNVLNYFTTLDNNNPDDEQRFICGPNGDQECRGADTAEEFYRQKTKIVAAIAEIDADVVGLIEIENNPTDEPTEDLVAGLNAVMGEGTYAYIPTGAIGPDAIRVAFIYKPATVAPLGDYAVLDSAVDPRFLDEFNRPVLAQTFMDKTTGGIFTAAVNHLKSKGSPCDEIGDPNTGDGAGNCNLTRLAAAEALVDWLATDPTSSGDADFMIIGDLNSYDKEDPINAILAGPDDTSGTEDDYADLLYEYQGEYAYTYVFDGQLGYLDYGLVNQDLLSEVTGATAWHINADEPDILDYDTSFKRPPQQELWEPNAFRSSDHDPVIIGLAVCDEIAPVFEELTVTPDVLWPPNHKYVEVEVTVVVSDNFDPDPEVALVSVTSNEPDNGLGDGDTPEDIVVIDDTHFLLRAERSGLGNDRVYTITYTVTDDCGNVTTESVTVTVPHNQ